MNDACGAVHSVWRLLHAREGLGQSATTVIGYVFLGGVHGVGVRRCTFSTGAREWLIFTNGVLVSVAAAGH